MPQCPDFIHFGDAEDPLTPIVSTARALDDDTATHIAALLGVTPAVLQEALCRSHTSNGTIIAQHLAVAPRALYAASKTTLIPSTTLMTGTRICDS